MFPRAKRRIIRPQIIMCEEGRVIGDLPERGLALNPQRVRAAFDRFAQHGQRGAVLALERLAQQHVQLAMLRRLQLGRHNDPPMTQATGSLQAYGQATLVCRCKNQSYCPVIVTTPCASAISTSTEAKARPREATSAVNDAAT